MIPGLDTCLFCMEVGSALSFDKKGKPYTFCHLCGARTFMRSPLSLRGLAVLVPHADQVRRTMSVNHEARALFDATVAEYQQIIMDRYAAVERFASQESGSPAAVPEMPLPQVAGARK